MPTGTAEMLQSADTAMPEKTTWPGSADTGKDGADTAASPCETWRSGGNGNAEATASPRQTRRDEGNDSAAAAEPPRNLRRHRNRQG